MATAAQRVHDEFEDDGLLWLLWLLGVALLCACAALCAVLRMDRGGILAGQMLGGGYARTPFLSTKLLT